MTHLSVAKNLYQNLRYDAKCSNLLRFSSMHSLPSITYLSYTCRMDVYRMPPAISHCNRIYDVGFGTSRDVSSVAKNLYQNPRYDANCSNLLRFSSMHSLPNITHFLYTCKIDLYRLPPAISCCNWFYDMTFGIMSYHLSSKIYGKI